MLKLDPSLLNENQNSYYFKSTEFFQNSNPNLNIINNKFFIVEEILELNGEMIARIKTPLLNNLI